MANLTNLTRKLGDGYYKFKISRRNKTSCNIYVTLASAE